MLRSTPVRSLTTALLATTLLVGGLLSLTQQPSAAVPADKDATQYVPCFGTGTDGSRVQAVYLRETDDPPMPTDGVPAIRQALWRLDQTVDASARKTDRSLRIRFEHGAPTVEGDTESCQPAIDEVVLPDNGQESWGAELTARGYIRSDRKLLVFTDSNGWTAEKCHASVVGPEGGGRAWLKQSLGCWNDRLLTHETLHLFGVSHLHDDGPDGRSLREGPDPMDAGGKDRPECNGPGSGVLLDCGEDTYFNPGKDSTTYLTGRHTGMVSPFENIAASSYFAPGRPAPDLAFRIHMRDSDMCLEPFSGTANPDAVVQLPCRNDDAQLWIRTANTDGYDTLKNRVSGKCLDVPGGNTTSGTVLQQHLCNSTNAQRWWLNSRRYSSGNSFLLLNKNSNALALSTRESGKSSGDVISLSRNASLLSLDFTATPDPAD